MHILFVGSHRADKQISIVGFEQSLEREFRGRLTFDTIQPGRKLTFPIKSKWARYVEKFILFPRELKATAKSADLVHFCEQGVALTLPHVKDKATLVTIHDFLAIEAARGQSEIWKVGWAGQRYQKLILESVRMSTGIACVSKKTRESMKTHLFDYSGEVQTILNGMYRPYNRLSESEALARLSAHPEIQPQSYYFHIGGNKQYKNRGGVLKIYAEMARQRPGLEMGLVMAGSGKTQELIEAEQKLGISDKVVWIKDPEDAQVEALYSLATGLIFPSFAEGFGLPIIEAQACGCPVFTTNRPPMTEVGGDAAVYFDCGDAAEAAHQVLAHADNTERLRQLGYQNVLRFDPKVMADSYFKFYGDLIAKHKSTRN